ncbi:hypothetical protein ACFW2D_29725 [Streptomyces sp. NPDC058914]|uniref:hypothetical protein n=1 Tax=Streptomyces TaxID=1883 RepID=UPI0036CEFFE7
MTEEATVWRSLAPLLPPVQAREVTDLRSIGEQEAALGLIVSGLLALNIAIREDTRALLAVTAEEWGEREVLEERISQCRSLHPDDSGVRVIATTDADPLAGPSLTTEPALADLLVVPWLTCVRCGTVLGRAHSREPWGDLSYLARHYVLFRPAEAAQPTLFGPEAAREAYAAVAACSGRRG